MKKQKTNKTIGVDAFCARLDEIFKTGMITKAQIIDAYNKSVAEAMPTGEERDKAAIDCIRNNDMLYELVIFKAGWDTCIKWFHNRMNSSEKPNNSEGGDE